MKDDLVFLVKVHYPDGTGNAFNVKAVDDTQAREKALKMEAQSFRHIGSEIPVPSYCEVTLLCSLDA